MTGRDSKCVFVANGVGEADVVVAWLNGEGIPAKVMGVAALQGALGWVPFNEFRARGLEVWVVDAAQAPLAARLIRERSEELKRSRGAQSDTPIRVICGQCGKSNLFSGTDRGTVQCCRNCGEYLDVEESRDPAGERSKSGFDEEH